MNAKKIAAEKAVSFIKDGMTVGIGTGSTVFFAIEAIGKLVLEGFKINAVASSIRSEELAKKNGINIIPFLEVGEIDIYIDGADEVDKSLNLIKGGGGALLREKILAYNSKKFIVIVDESKLVDELGKFPLPVEVIPFAHELTLRNLEKLGCIAAIRTAGKQNYLTDNGNIIIDCDFKNISDVEDLNQRISRIPGVVENGLFLKGFVNTIVAGYESGEIEILQR